MADGVLSMFMTPEQYQLMQNTAQQQRAMDFAKLDPMAQAQYGIYLGASQLGGAIGRGLGGEDRQLKLISQRQALSKEIDPSDPESILRVAQRAAQSGDQQFALSLSDYARQAASEIALAKQRLEERRNAIAPDIQVAKYRGGLLNAIEALKDTTDPQLIKQREAYQRELDALPTKAGDTTNEIKNANEMAIRDGFKPGTPEFDKAVSTNLNKLTAKGGNVKEVGVAAGTREAVYVDPNTDMQFTYGKDKEGKQVRIPYFGGIDRTVSKTDVSMNTKVEGEVLQGLAKVDVARVKDAIAAADSSRAALRSLKQLDNLTEKDLISGPYAGTLVGATNLLNQLGLISKDDASTLASSEMYQKSAKDLVMASLNNKLGAGISNADRSFIEGIVPQLETSPKARKALIKFMTEKNLDIINEAKAMEKELRDKKSLGNYEPKTVLPTAGNDVIRSQLEALKRERAAAAARERK
jgi:uncharacterized membrane protein